MGTAEVTIDYKGKNLLFFFAMAQKKNPIENVIRRGDKVNVCTSTHYPASIAHGTLSPLSDKKTSQETEIKGLAFQ